MGKIIKNDDLNGRLNELLDKAAQINTKMQEMEQEFIKEDADRLTSDADIEKLITDQVGAVFLTREVADYMDRRFPDLGQKQAEKLKDIEEEVKMATECQYEKEDLLRIDEMLGDLISISMEIGFRTGYECGMRMGAQIFNG